MYNGLFPNGFVSFFVFLFIHDSVYDASISEPPSFCDSTNCRSNYPESHLPSNRTRSKNNVYNGPANKDIPVNEGRRINNAIEKLSPTVFSICKRSFFFIVLSIGKLLIATVPTMEIRINVSLFGLTEARLNKNSRSLLSFK